MFHVTIKDRILIAHSLNSEVFGPAQHLHGATFEVEVTFESTNLGANNIVIDMGYAHQILQNSLTRYNYKNLDEIEALKQQLTTTEYLSKRIWDDIVKLLKESDQAVKHISSLKVVLNESLVASAGFEDGIVW